MSQFEENKTVKEPLHRTATLKAGRASRKKKCFVYIAMVVLSILSTYMCYTGLGKNDWHYSSVFMIFIIWSVGVQTIKPRVQTGPPVVAPKSKKINKRTIMSGLICLLLIPITIYIGVVYLNDRSYYFISLAIVIYTMIPFFMSFEGRKPQAREIIVISVLAAIAVAGRAAFFMLPHFKPVVAIVIISGVCFGGEAGFLVGAVSAMVSNFFFGQGPWTPWQMFAFGIIGFIAGVLFQKGWLKTSKLPLCIFGGIATFGIYGPIMNLSSAMMWTSELSWGLVLARFATGVPVDMVHGVSTIFFLSVFSQPFIEKLERIKKKYGLLEN